MIRVSELKLPVTGNQKALEKKLAKALRVPVEEIKAYRIFKRSLDARKKDNIHYAYVVDVEVKNENKILEKNKEKHISKTPDLAYHLPKGENRPSKRPVVVGFGPAGMFAALLLAEMGLQPIVLERGGDVDSRKQAVDTFWQTGKLDAESNVQFGEGGAGTFSDGKLTTRIKDPRCRKVLEEMVDAGAPEEILYDAKPHIGTDLLRGVVKQLREKIISLGGEVRFFAKVTGFQWENDRVQAVFLQNGEKIEAEDVVLALGHSARDTFTLLYEEKFALEQKPFAMGVRIEHPQVMIDAVQYGNAAAILPAADYRLTYTTQKNRGVYTFCMCPGGFIVPAASGPEQVVVNGMSPSNRGSRWSNSGMVVEIQPEDLRSGELRIESGELAAQQNERLLAINPSLNHSQLSTLNSQLLPLHFQEELERQCWLQGGRRQTAPAQRMMDFTRKKLSYDLPESSYSPGIISSPLHFWLPPFISKRVSLGFQQFGRSSHGFLTNEAVMIGVETRTSSPVRIVRDKETLQHITVRGLFPCGEGAGYAGGIVSAGIDGERCAEAAANYLHH